MTIADGHPNRSRERRTTPTPPVDGVGVAGVNGPDRVPGTAVGIHRRLVTWMLVAVGVAVLLLGVPLAAVVRNWVFGQQIADVRNEARQVIAVLDGNPDQLTTVVSLSADALDARVTVLDAAARVIRDSAGVQPGTVFDDGPVQQALVGRDGGELIGSNLVVAAPGTVGRSSIVVRLAEPAGDVEGRVGNALLAILGLGVVALAVGAALASWRARQLSEPLQALAISARRLGQGDFSGRAAHSDIVEIEQIALALDATAARLRTALERSASFSADASHQLRTPLTALRLNLETLAVETGESASLEAATAEVDRLEATIAELLELADAGVEPDEVDLRALTLTRLDAWRTLADAAGRAVRVTRTPVPLVRARPSAVGQALQVLLDNALTHGRGDVTVWLEPLRRGERVWVRLCVGDEGRGVTHDDLTDGQGRGLPLAQSLVEAEGGRLVLDATHGNRVCLLMPAVDDPARTAVDDAAP
ncbi:HAMP domain-containing sensor histidine kinase [soil metagenome]